MKKALWRGLSTTSDMHSNVEKTLLLERIRQHPEYREVENCSSEALRATENGLSDKPHKTYVRQVQDSYGLKYEIQIECHWPRRGEKDIRARVHFQRGSSSVSEIYMEDFQSVRRMEHFYDVWWLSLGKPYVEPTLN